MFTRIVCLSVDAYVFFESCADRCAVIMEDPSGAGRKFVASLDGHGQWLRQNEDEEVFFQQWKHALKAVDSDSPAIRLLFYAAYEASIALETLPEPLTQTPEGLIWLHQPVWSLCFDAEKRCVFMASIRSEAELDELELMLKQAGQTCDASFPCVSMPAWVESQITERTHTDYRRMVPKVIQYIEAGDVFQANIARLWQMPCQEHHLLAIYKSLRSVNSAPFSCFLKADALTIISASPERLFRINQQRVVETRPIAGTRKRSKHQAGDDELREELLLSDKERAEHLMLVDLERNDLGRVCKPGSVEVDEFMSIEAYATVQHIVSNVRGILRDDCDVVDVFKAMFPGGTITGCPKIRCMEIIHELEAQARGPYTGGVGYVAWNGEADMNILIRTFWHHEEKLHWAAGAGIVADSNPQHEKSETEHKAEGLLRALGKLKLDQ
ncbi:MAG: aminodeoxychorismate synthase component I [Zetaproteobacteria bacterium CG_4_9_14_3_um_filter_49_83]|nr:MAG: aminodeoxychorismate synthase component I [Zetaproteobacteria bacterium CG1_02_49_23]PIQ32759.1 MAG: aminodeoxychorismate synthase component I [Zetaproteobacteria bacterium CG17_big_fil_post_rev_8_21_14_2_50_50_13]PIV29273.1 MAG: aminodeoxychorismate synthase component I [Zetaproteobacteria bacterium CG02_land_8_20_14_3_00_50_9]PIY54953.1 MAG: aminodeoxychorismate synthase component I [Zetaproteobacteria bacterium CG_4_10_14_0_8_um_filter_49_80]PJA35327.1 MAG: aminodeoxychorismate synth